MMNTHEGGDDLGLEPLDLGYFPWEMPSGGETPTSPHRSTIWTVSLLPCWPMTPKSWLVPARSGRRGPGSARRSGPGWKRHRPCLGVLKRAWQGDDRPLIEGLSIPTRSVSLGAVGDVNSNPDTDALRKIGRFTILGELGHGGFGIVYLAHDPAIGRSGLEAAAAGDPDLAGAEASVPGRGPGGGPAQAPQYRTHLYFTRPGVKHPQIAET